MAFVRACDGDEAAWLERWQRLHALVNGAPNPDAPPAGRRRRRSLFMAVLAAAVVLAVAAVAVVIWWRDEPASTVANGSDPQEQH